MPLIVNTTISPAITAVFSFWPALNRPCGGLGPICRTCHFSQRRSSSSNRSIWPTVRRSPPVDELTIRNVPNQNASAAPRWIVFHSRRLAATSASDGR